MPTMLVIGSGRDIYREYALRALAARYSLVLLEQKPISWQRKYILESRPADWDQPDVVVELATALDNQHHFSGVMTYDELLVELVAQVAEALGLPGNDRASAYRCRDKSAMRRAFAQAGVPSAASRLVMSLDEARTAADQIGYPVVLKPRSLGGSIGVIRVDTPAALAAGYAVVAEATCPGFPHVDGALVEEYLEGPEISVESVVVRGEVSIIAITQKEVGFEPFFEETGHIISAGEPLPDEAAIRDVVRQAHAALGVAVGATHTELRLTPRGPRMLELAARLGGDMIPYLAYLATGVDVAGATADAVCGRAPDLRPARSEAAAIRFLYPSGDVRVKRLDLDPRAADLPWLDQVTWAAKPGDELRPPPHGFLSRIGFVVVRGKDAAECQARIEQAMPYVHIDLEPVFFE